MTDTNNATAKTYNGYTNYETWAVALWLDNEQGSSEHWADRAEEAYRDSEATAHSTRAEVASRSLAEEIKAEHEEANPVADQSSVFADLMNAALGEVNWDEIATNYIDDLDTDAIDAEDAPDDDDEPTDDPRINAALLRADRLDRAQLVALLESVSIECHDVESDDVLLEAVRENLIDGTIEPDSVD